MRQQVARSWLLTRQGSVCGLFSIQLQQPAFPSSFRTQPVEVDSSVKMSSTLILSMQSKMFRRIASVLREARSVKQRSNCFSAAEFRPILYGNSTPQIFSVFSVFKFK